MHHKHTIERISMPSFYMVRLRDTAGYLAKDGRPTTRIYAARYTSVVKARDAILRRIIELRDLTGLDWSVRDYAVVHVSPYRRVKRYY